MHALETKPPYYDVFDEHFCTNKKVCADGVIDNGAGAKPAGVTSAGEAEAAAAERRKNLPLTSFTPRYCQDNA